MQRSRDEAGTVSQSRGDAADLESNKREPAEAPMTKEENSTNSSAFLVRFELGEPENPMNFNPYFKAWLTLALGLLALVGSIGASIIAPAELVISNTMGVSQEVSVLALALFVLGMLHAPPRIRSTLLTSRQGTLAGR